MHQFTADQVVAFRARLQREPGILDELTQQIQPVREHYRIPETGIATWTGFFACPKHSVVLEFDISNPDAYRCPVDGEMLTGEPYAGAWWRALNSVNEHACTAAALRYLLLGEADDLDLARNILVDYAKRYPGYEVHGGIPYNNPGKANAQTLCDSMWIKGLASAYDIIREELSEDDCALIERDLLHCAAEFLMGQRSDQIHNHECIVSSALGILGILLDEPRYITFALDTPYGLHYQLEHAVLSDGFWFEGTPGYHFYAMEQFIDFERFAAQTPYSFFKIPRFIEVLKFPLRMLQPNNLLPLLNDSTLGRGGFAGTGNLYELAFAKTKDMDFARILHMAYAEHERMNRYSFFDGVEVLPEVSPAPQEDYHGGEAHSSGLTTMHGPDGRYLLVKHSPYGGEHDHYDRLGLHFVAFGEYIAPDMGTSQYGAPLHYAYYKNTAAHNTVCIDGQNHPPTDCRVVSYTKNEEFVELIAETAWDGSYKMLDSFTIKQWSDEAYAGAVFRRNVRWYGDFFVDCFDVTLPEAREIVWTLHGKGTLEHTPAPCGHMPKWAWEGPGQYLQGVTMHEPESAVLRFSWQTEGGNCLDVFPVTEAQTQYATAHGPDNPSVKTLPYLLEKKLGMAARFVNVICASRKGEGIQDVRSVPNGLEIIRGDGRLVRYVYPQ